MQITKVQDKGEIYLVNDTESVAKVSGNRHYSMVQDWLSEEGNELSPAFTIEELKEDLKSELQVIRNSNFQTTVTHAKGEFLATEGAYLKLSASTVGLNGSSTEWRDINNNMLTLTEEECKEILRIIKAAHTPIYAKESAVAIQIDNEADITVLENFDLQDAWDNA